MEATLRQDQQLTEHFSLYEMTTTSEEAHLEANRTLSDAMLEEIRKTAEHAEIARALRGLPCMIHSGYRAPALNAATPGSSSTSQHPKGEAFDCHFLGESLEDSLQGLVKAAKAGQFTFGQIILEEAARPYGIARWLHISRIGTLAPEKVGQVMLMSALEDPKQPHYRLIEKLNFE